MTVALTLYGAANLAEDDISTQGGAINTNLFYIWSNLAVVNDTVSVLGFLDSSDVEIIGRNSFGESISEIITASGVSLIDGNVTFDSIDKVIFDPISSGPIGVKKTSAGSFFVSALASANTQTYVRPFLNLESRETGGGVKQVYEKVFIKNTGDETFFNVSCKEITDPDNVDFALAGQNDSESVSNRLVAPSNVGTFNSLTKIFPDSDLVPGSGQVMWLRLTMSEDTTNTFEVNIAFSGEVPA